MTEGGVLRRESSPRVTENLQGGWGLLEAQVSGEQGRREGGESGLAAIDPPPLTAQGLVQRF